MSIEGRIEPPKDLKRNSYNLHVGVDNVSSPSHRPMSARSLFAVHKPGAP